MTLARHGTMEELLALRDGEGSAWMRSHAEACAGCAAELRRLEQVRASLKALPSFQPPRDRWSTIRPQVRRERRQRVARGAVGVATAAALAVLTFVTVRPRHPDVATERAALQREMTRSSALEQALKSLNPDRQALNGDAALVAAELNDRLSQLDIQLSSPSLRERSQAIELWRERAGVLSALVDVHSTRAAVASF